LSLNGTIPQEALDRVDARLRAEAAERKAQEIVELLEEKLGRQ
jgi:hypothetical protein